MSRSGSRHRVPLTLGGIALSLLLAAVFTFGSLNVPFEPQNWRDVLTLYAVSAFITAAFLVFALILTRTLLRTLAESSKDHLGARFRTKMVMGAMAISLLPVLFMFFVSYSLLNRTLARWFPRPLEIAFEQTQAMLDGLGRSQLARLRALAQQAAPYAALPNDEFLHRALSSGADAAWILGKDGKAVRGGVICEDTAGPRTGAFCVQAKTLGSQVQVLASGLELWSAGGKTYFAARVPVLGGGRGESLVAAFHTSPEFYSHLTTIQEQTREYDAQKQNLRALKRQMLLILLFFTVLVLSAVTWLALFLAKQVTVPIQALAEGTREVSAGNFEYEVPEQAQDELGLLVRSFNSMTMQLRDSRSQIDEFTRNLQQAVQELERRRQLMETVLESIPTAVLSLDASGAILRANSAVARMFGEKAAPSLEVLLGAEANRVVTLLMRRALRMGVVSREIETVVGGSVLHLAVTVSSLGPRRANIGYIVVLDDLTELLRAQKSAAWQEVARRIAHEIKNPLTPIQLSAQRLSRFLERRDSGAAAVAGVDSELTKLTQECSRLIEREVASLAALVNEFSDFVRFPTAKLVPVGPNTVVREALEVFSGRLDGIVTKMHLAEPLPAVRADSALLRGVVVNLIDNAAEALEGSPVREILVSTRLCPESDSVEICVADTGHGISPQDKDKLFLPHFSTKGRGTGLGLAIAARIVAEHGGSIHVEDNFPVGSRFRVELPVADLTAASAIEQNGSESAR